MNICLVQSDIVPDHKKGNLSRCREILQQMKKKPDVIVLPEMFSCGFSPLLLQNAEPLEGESTLFLYDIAREYQCDIVGTIPVKIESHIYNRLLWINKEGHLAHYDKKHLYFGEEKEYCTPGSQKVIIQSEEFKILPLICYDIRFPVWCRNQYVNGKFLYDALLITANFPAPRAGVLQQLARARAIENQAFVVVCNRVGKDGNGNSHKGKSMLVNPLGKIVAEAEADMECLLEASMDKRLLEKIRKKFPVYKDWD